MSEETPTNRSEINLNEKLWRELPQLDRAELNDDSRSLTLSYASQEPVERLYRGEIIEEIIDVPASDYTRMNAGAPLLLNHDPDQQIGVVEKSWIGSNHEGDPIARASVKFSRSERGEEIYTDVKDGIRRSTSVGYELTKELRREERDGMTPRVYFSGNFLEASIVAVPADISVGVGRSQAETAEQTEPKTKLNTKSMSEESTPAPTSKIEVVHEPTKDQREKIAADALRDERKRFNEIDSAADQLDNYEGITKIAQEAKREGWSVARFNEAAIQAISSGDVPQRPIGLTKREQRAYMITDGIRAAAQQQPIDGIVGEVSAHMAKRTGKTPPSNGFWVPMELGAGRSIKPQHFRTDMTTVEAAAGEDLYPDVHRGDLLIENLRPQLLMESLGARIINVSSAGALSIPKLSGSTSLTWQTEATATTESNPTTATVNLVPYEGATYTDMSWRLLEHSDPGVEGLVRLDLNETIAQGLDQAWVSGSGTNRPEGVEVGCTGIFSTATNASPTRAECLEAEADVATANSLFGNSIYWLTTPTVRQNMRNIQEDSGSGRFLWSDDSEVIGYNAVASNYVTASKIVFGRFSDYLGVVFGGAMILTDQYSQAASRLLRIHACVMADGEVRHGASFSENA
ncbi:phage major capsid protein [bacterium]|nr:phage major capsid protein [bacterium]